MRSIWKNKGIAKSVTLAVVFAISFILYYFWGTRNFAEYSADPAFSIVTGKEIMSGNVFLKDWYGAQNILYLLSVVYGLFGELLGYSFALLPFVSALFWACMLTLIAGILLKRYADSPIQGVARVGFVFALCFSSCFVVQHFGIFWGTHFDFVLIGIFYMWILSREIESCVDNTLSLVIASVLLFFAVLSDNLTVLFVILPALGGLALELLFYAKEKIKKRYVIKHFILLIAIFVAAKVFLGFMQANEMMMTASVTTQLVEYSDLFPDIAYFIKSTLYLFGCDFFGQNIGRDNAALLLRLMIFAVLLIGLLLNSKTILKTMLNRMLALCVVMEMLTIVLTSTGADKVSTAWTSRLLVSLFFSLVLLFAQIDWGEMVSKFKMVIDKRALRTTEVIAVALLLVMDFASLSPWRKVEPYDPALSTAGRIGSVLAERGLTKGFGIYWLSSNVTVASDFQVDVRPITAEHISAFHWLSKSTKDWDYANFVLVDKSRWGGVTEENIIEDIGIPSEKISVDDATILIWDKNIMPYIKDSGYPGETLVGWWSLDPGQTEKTIETTSRHFSSQFAANKDGYFTSDAAGHVLYGPYMSMSEGTYDITFEYDYAGTLGPGEVLGQVDASSNAQKVKAASCAAVAGENSVTMRGIQVLPECTDFETRFYANVEGITVRRITVKRTGM